jgi:hypothetical protein
MTAFDDSSDASTGINIKLIFILKILPALHNGLDCNHLI